MKQKLVKLTTENCHVIPMDPQLTSDLDPESSANQVFMAIRLLSVNEDFLVRGVIFGTNISVERTSVVLMCGLSPAPNRFKGDVHTMVGWVPYLEVKCVNCEVYLILSSIILVLYDIQSTNPNFFSLLGQTFLVFRRKDLYLVITQKLTFMKSGRFSHEIWWISQKLADLCEIHLQNL